MHKSTRFAQTLTCIALLGSALAAPAGEYAVSEQAVLTTAPGVPPTITRTEPAKVVIDLEVTEYTAELADGVEYTFGALVAAYPAPSCVCVKATWWSSTCTITLTTNFRTILTCMR